MIHYGVSLEAHERESSPRVLKFILFLSAPVRLTNPSAARVQTVPEDPGRAHVNPTLGFVSDEVEVESGRPLLKGSPPRTSVNHQKQIGKDKSHSFRDKCVLHILRGCACVFFLAETDAHLWLQ